MYFQVEEYETIYYRVMPTDAFYECLSPFYNGGSYFYIYFRLFGLPPHHFFHWAGATYHMYFQKSTITQHLKTFFLKKEDAQAFCDELNRRFSFCAKRGDFN